MTKIFLVLLYLWLSPDGSVQVKLDKKQMPSMEACQEKGADVAKDLIADPRFEAGLFAGCVDLSAQEASK